MFFIKLLCYNHMCVRVCASDIYGCCAARCCCRVPVSGFWVSGLRPSHLFCFCLGAWKYASKLLWCRAHVCVCVCVSTFVNVCVRHFCCHNERDACFSVATALWSGRVATHHSGQLLLDLRKIKCLSQGKSEFFFSSSLLATLMHWPEKTECKTQLPQKKKYDELWAYLVGNTFS